MVKEVIMSWFDLVIILIIGGGALWGYKSGFFSSAFRILSMVASLFIAYTIFPIVSSVLKGSFLFANINKPVVKTLEGIMKGPQFQGAANGAKGSLVNQLVYSLPVPDGFKASLAEKSANVHIPGASGAIDAAKNSAVDAVGKVLTGLIIDVIAIIVVIILVRVILFIIEILLSGVFKLPVLKGINKSAGFILGVVEGILVVFVVTAIIPIFNSGTLMNELNSSLKESFLGGIFYDQNFILKFLNK